ncbi:MAG: hypothetical protein ABEJ93_01305 [Candidatus Nanohalobium sp.]
MGLEGFVESVLGLTDAEKIFAYPGTSAEEFYLEVEEREGVELVQGVREQHLLHMAQTRY